MASVQLQVNSLTGKVWSINAEMSWSVQELKDAIRAESSIPALEQSLLWGDVLWSDTELLSNLCQQHCAEDDGFKCLTLVRRSSDYASWKRRMSLASHYVAYREAPDMYKEDYDFCLTAVHACEGVYQFLPERFKNDHRMVIAAVARDPFVFEDLPEELRADVDVAWAAVKKSGAALKFAVPEIRANLSVVRNAVENHYQALFYSDASCWDYDLVLDALDAESNAKRRRCQSLVSHPQIQQLCALKNFALAAVQRDPTYLRLVSNLLQMDREVVECAVSRDGSALQWASAELRDDDEIVASAVKNKAASLRFASRRLRDDRELVLSAVKSEAHTLCYASKDLQSFDAEIVITALRNSNAGVMVR
mmetsp:Transcript_76563/g.140182  ORF Transcript_76563/g.140182 Transcript_76563/m.140182 type:complete len:364 (-) Transcript_76563:18-1109(-)